MSLELLLKFFIIVIQDIFFSLFRYSYIYLMNIEIVIFIFPLFDQICIKYEAVLIVFSV